MRKFATRADLAAPDSLERVKPYADKLVCLAAPPGFYSVGQFYLDFPQIEDDEVARLLARTGTPRAQARHHETGNQPP